jgi:5-methylcytosine-specific restriction protein A
LPIRAKLFTTRATIARRTKDQLDHSRSSAQTYNKTWRGVRKIKLQINPLCEQCSLDDRVTVASMVHHKQTVKDRPDLRLEIGNLESMCVSCHGKRHAKPNGAMQ